MMISDVVVSDTARRLNKILSDLERQTVIDNVVLCTADGLPVDVHKKNLGNISAVSGFLLSAANLSSNLLGQGNCQEMTIEYTDDVFLVCQLFSAGNVQLILTILFNQRLPYKRLMKQKVREIQLALEN